MIFVYNSVSDAEFAADKKAVAATDFCSLWPAGRAALVALAGVVSSSLVKFAINTVISAGDAYCGHSTSAASVKASLDQAGIKSVDDLADRMAQHQTIEFSHK